MSKFHQPPHIQQTLPCASPHPTKITPNPNISHVTAVAHVFKVCWTNKHREAQNHQVNKRSHKQRHVRWMFYAPSSKCYQSPARVTSSRRKQYLGPFEVPTHRRNRVPRTHLSRRTRHGFGVPNFFRRGFQKKGINMVC